MVQIFLEGRETIFIENLINKTWQKHEIDDYETVNAGGWTKLHLIANKFIQNTDKGGINLLIFDSDSPENEGGFNKRKQQLEQKRMELGIQFEIFLFPDHQSRTTFYSA